MKQSGARADKMDAAFDSRTEFAQIQATLGMPQKPRLSQKKLLIPEKPKNFFQMYLPSQPILIGIEP